MPSTLAGYLVVPKDGSKPRFYTTMSNAKNGRRTKYQYGTGGPVATHGKWAEDPFDADGFLEAQRAHVAAMADIQPVYFGKVRL